MGYLKYLAFLPIRFWRAWRFYAWVPGRIFTWLFTSRETTNFTFQLEEKNRQYLAALVAEVTRQPIAAVLEYFDELENNSPELETHHAKLARASKFWYKTDRKPLFARRLAWYALVRILKPKVVVETGVDKGLGAILLTTALLRNQQEGHPGRYYGTDINPEAGYFLTEPYNTTGEILYGDSIESLKQFDQPIDLFINDSDHSVRYERDEYEVIREKLTPGGVIVSDNADISPALLDFCREYGFHFLYHLEQPVKHWYPGAGLGIAWRGDQDS